MKLGINFVSTLRTLLISNRLVKPNVNAPISIFALTHLASGGRTSWVYPISNRGPQIGGIEILVGYWVQSVIPSRNRFV